MYLQTLWEVCTCQTHIAARPAGEGTSSMSPVGNHGAFDATLAARRTRPCRAASLQGRLLSSGPEESHGDICVNQSQCSRDRAWLGPPPPCAWELRLMHGLSGIPDLMCQRANAVCSAIYRSQPCAA